jgi:hypothetical protein
MSKILVGFLFWQSFSTPMALAGTCDAERILAQPSVIDAYRSLQKEHILLCQTDSILYTSGLALASGTGGMCAAANALNAFRALAKFARKDFDKDPLYYLESMLNYLKVFEHIEGRLGLYDEHAAIGLSYLASQMDLPIHFSFGRAKKISDYLTKPNEILMASFRGRYFDDDFDDDHTLTITSIDLLTKQISYSEPNEPDHEFHATLKERKSGGFDLVAKEYGDFYGSSLNFFKMETPDDDAFRKPKLTKKQARSFIGKNVLVRWKSGILQLVHVAKFLTPTDARSLGSLQFRSAALSDPPLQTKPVEAIENAKIIKSVPKKPARPIHRDEIID